MSKNKQRLWLFFMLFLYAIIAVVGFGIAYFVKTTFFQAKQAVPKVSSITPLPTQPGWKTYTNSSVKITFSYPPTDTVKTSSYGFGVTSLMLSQTNGDVDLQMLLLPKTLAQTVGQDFDGYYAMQDNTSKVIKSPLSQDNATETFTKIDNRSINGLKALDYQSVSSNAKPDAQPEIGTFIQAGSNLILISTGKSNKTALEQMLESFRYTQ